MDVGKKAPSYIDGELQIGAATLESNMEILQKT